MAEHESEQPDDLQPESEALGAEGTSSETTDEALQAELRDIAALAQALPVLASLMRALDIPPAQFPVWMSLGFGLVVVVAALGVGFGDDPILLVHEHRDLVAAQRIVSLGLVRGRREFATVAGRAIVVEDDLAVQVFEARHGNSCG